MANTITTENKLQKELVRRLDKATVVYPYANTKYEGTLKKSGQTVTVQMVPNLSRTTGGTAGADISMTDITMTKENLTVGTVAQVGFKISDYESVVANIDVISEMAKRVAYSQADLLDTTIMAFYTDALTANKLYDGVLSVTPTSATIYGYIEEMAVQLDTQNVPRGGNRVLFVNPSQASLIRQSALFDGTAKGLDMRINGFVGYISGFTVLMTNNYATDATYNYMVAMDRESIHFVSQLTKIKITDSPDGFYKKFLGEMVYGGKVFAENSKRIVTLGSTI